LTPTPEGPVWIRDVSTENPYRVVPAEIGANIYSDRDFRIARAGIELDGAYLVQTPNDDDYVDASEHLRIHLTGSATVYVCWWGGAAAEPDWLLERGWRGTGKTIDVKIQGSTVPYRIYEKTVGQGREILGGNDRQNTGAVGNYFLIIQAN
jgi:hypothetical protein